MNVSIQYSGNKVKVSFAKAARPATMAALEEAGFRQHGFHWIGRAGRVPMAAVNKEK